MKGLTSLEILQHQNGRFGNQLFRIGTLIGESLKKNTNYYIPLEWEHCNIFPNLKNKLSVNQIKPEITKSYKEEKFGFNIIPETSGILEILGYFQSWKFFEGFEDIIKNELSFCEDLIQNAKSKMSNETIKLCVHLRWGDVYDRRHGCGHKGLEDRHPVMSLKYYENAIEYVLQKTKIDEILVFTDNVDTKEFIVGKFEKYGIKVIYFDYSDNFVLDFVCQNLCDHFVIPNSTFSWWSSFLSKNPNKIICCPNESDWFGPTYKNLDRSELLPLSWKRIEQI